MLYILCWALSQVYYLIINIYYLTIFMKTYKVDIIFIPILQMGKLMPTQAPGLIKM